MTFRQNLNNMIAHETQDGNRELPGKIENQTFFVFLFSKLNQWKVLIFSHFHFPAWDVTPILIIPWVFHLH